MHFSKALRGTAAAVRDLERPPAHREEEGREHGAELDLGWAEVAEVAECRVFFQGSFPAVSKPMFAGKYAFGSIFKLSAA